jgi:hypothetical protein
MTPERYTDDAVCFAMGLGQFALAATGDAVRIVCRPSFHPEVCLTFTPEELVAVALRWSLSSEPMTARMPDFSERARLSAGEFEDLSAAFDRALAESKRPPKWVVIADGMSASAVRVLAGRLDRYAGHAVNEQESHFARGALSLAIAKVRTEELRNRISWCGRYVHPRDDRTFPVTPEPSLPKPTISRLLVMGTPDDRAEFHAMFGPGAGPRRGSRG